MTQFVDQKRSAVARHARGLLDKEENDANQSIESQKLPSKANKRRKESKRSNAIQQNKK